MPDVNLREFERMRNGGARTSVRVQPAGTGVTGHQINLGNRPSLREVGVVGAPAWTAEQTETWVRTSTGTICPRRLTVYEGGKKDIDRTFEFGDDFDGATLNDSKWTTFDTPTIANSQIVCDSGSDGARAKGGFSTNFSIRFLASLGLNSVNTNVIGLSNATTITFGPALIRSTAYTLVADTWGVDVAVSTDAGMYTYEIKVIGTTSRTLYKNGVQIGTLPNTTDLNTNLKYPLIARGGANANGTVSAGWMLVRKYSPNEPVAGTAQPSASNRSMCQSLNLADGLRACCAA